MRRKLLVLFTMIFTTAVFAQEAAVDEALSERRANYQINDYYKAGNYLIFDCWRGFYTCVDEDGFKRCREKRQEDMDKKLKEYTCAPLNKFPSKTACAKKNYEVIEANAKKRFCFPKTDPKKD